MAKKSMKHRSSKRKGVKCSGKRKTPCRKSKSCSWSRKHSRCRKTGSVYKKKSATKSHKKSHKSTKKSVKKNNKGKRKYKLNGIEDLQGVRRYLNDDGVWMESGLKGTRYIQRLYRPNGEKVYEDVETAVRHNSDWFNNQSDNARLLLVRTDYSLYDEHTGAEFYFDVIEDYLSNPDFVSFRDVIRTFKRMFNESY
jgi:hypothetical protein